MDLVREPSSNIALNTRVSPLYMNAAFTLLVWRPSRATLRPFTALKTKAENDLNPLTFGNSLLLLLLVCHFTTASRHVSFSLLICCHPFVIPSSRQGKHVQVLF